MKNFGYKKISDDEIKAVYSAKDLETKKRLALDILNSCIKSSPSIIKIKNDIQRTSSPLLIDKKMTYLLLVQDGSKVIKY